MDGESNMTSATPELTGFKKKQYEFTAYIRDPESHPAPTDIEARRINLYRDLMFNNVEDILANNFPVLRRLLDDRSWRGLVQDYFAHHQCKTPYFAEIPEEFIDYLQHERGEQDGDLPFMLELAHYEWVEMALSIAEGEVPAEIHLSADDLAAGVFSLSSLAWPLVYRYPVHRITQAYQPLEPPEQPTYLALYRDREDAVHFLEINPLTYKLMQTLDANNDVPSIQIISSIADQSPGLNRKSVIDGGIEMLTTLQSRGMLAAISSPA